MPLDGWRSLTGLRYLYTASYRSVRRRLALTLVVGPSGMLLRAPQGVNMRDLLDGRNTMSVSGKSRVSLVSHTMQSLPDLTIHAFVSPLLCLAAEDVRVGLRLHFLEEGLRRVRHDISRMHGNSRPRIRKVQTFSCCNHDTDR